MAGTTIAAIVLILLAVLTVWKSVVTVRQGFEYTIERFGRFTRSMRPGIHFLVPYIERIGARADEAEPALFAARGKAGVLAEEAVARMNGVAAGLDGDGQQLLRVQVGGGARAA